MRVREFFALKPVAGVAASQVPTRWSLPVVPELCSGLGALFGGVGLGACIDVLERVTARPCVWATAQYLSFVRPPAVLDLDVTIGAVGRKVSQGRVLATVDGNEILTVNAALGRRSSERDTTWERPPEVPAPADCALRPILPRQQGTIAERIEVRLADAVPVTEMPAGRRPDGRSALWIRIPELRPEDRASGAGLAVLGDFIPFGIGQALGDFVGGNSLDNTLRVVSDREDDAIGWILADIRVHAIGHGFGHGLVHLWDEAGTLLATASQSTIVRARMPGDPGGKGSGG